MNKITMNSKPKKAQIFEDTEIVLNKPYNALKELFNTDRFNVSIYKQDNTGKDFIFIREKNAINMPIMSKENNRGTEL